jgi:hypothetical protein
MRAALALAGLWVAFLLPALSWGQATFKGIRAEGTEFRVTLSDGRVLSSAHLVGAVLSVAGLNSELQTVRIDAVEPDPVDPDHEVQLHTLSVLDHATGSWSNLCDPGPDGVAKAFPLSGSWSPDGRHLSVEQAFSLICTGGAIGKCVRWGYKPWRSTSAGVSLWDYHQACVRMVRADYGGDGVGHTRDDTPIDVFDQLGIVPPASDPGKLTFEASWGAHGAICIRKPRYPDIISLDELERRYPHLVGRTGDTCQEGSAGPEAMILNRS